MKKRASFSPWISVTGTSQSVMWIGTELEEKGVNVSILFEHGP